MYMQQERIESTSATAVAPENKYEYKKLPCRFDKFAPDNLMEKIKSGVQVQTVVLARADLPNEETKNKSVSFLAKNGFTLGEITELAANCQGHFFGLAEGESISDIEAELSAEGDKKFIEIKSYYFLLFEGGTTETVVSSGYEYCSKLMLFYQGNRDGSPYVLCLDSHLPIEESSVVHFIEEVFAPLLDHLVAEKGIELAQCEIKVLYGDDSSNPDCNKNRQLPGQLLYNYLRERYVSQVAKIELNAESAVGAGDEIQVCLGDGRVTIERYLEESVEDSAGNAGEGSDRSDGELHSASEQEEHSGSEEENQGALWGITTSSNRTVAAASDQSSAQADLLSRHSAFSINNKKRKAETSLHRGAGDEVDDENAASFGSSKDESNKRPKLF